MVTELLWMDRGVPCPCVMKSTSFHEGWIYRRALTEREAPRLLGVAGAEAGVWLFLERLSDQSPDFADSAAVAAVYRSMAALHCRFLGRLSGGPGPLLAPPAAGAREALAAAGAGADLTRWALHSLFGGPQTLVHGDLHRDNIFMGQEGIRLVDWEHAGTAHPIWDLVQIAPGEPGWVGVPTGDQAVTALRAYHADGLLACLTWREFVTLHTAARLVLAAWWARRHAARAAATPAGGAREVMLAYAQREGDRVRALLAALGV